MQKTSTARIVAQRLGDSLGQNVVVENRMKAEWVKWGPVVKATGAKVD